MIKLYKECGLMCLKHRWRIARGTNQRLHTFLPNRISIRIWCLHGECRKPQNKARQEIKKWVQCGSNNGQRTTLNGRINFSSKKNHICNIWYPNGKRLTSSQAFPFFLQLKKELTQKPLTFLFSFYEQKGCTIFKM